MNKTEKKELAPITVERRQQIMAKDIIRISELGELLGVPYDTAQKIMKKIKGKYNRLEIVGDLTGMLHIQDYLDCLNLPSDRYYGIAIQIGGVSNDN